MAKSGYEMLFGKGSEVTPERLAAFQREWNSNCLLYTSDAADDLLCVDLGGRRIIKKKKQRTHTHGLKAE